MIAWNLDSNPEAVRHLQFSDCERPGSPAY